MPKPDDYLWDGTGTPDPEVARLESVLAPLRHTAPLDEIRLARERRSRAPYVIAGAVVATAAAALVWWRLPQPPRTPAMHACGTAATGFAFEAVDGAVACDGAALPAGVLPVGATLDTGATQARLAIADIGSAQLGPATRVRLDRTSAHRHQLFLERGSMHAKVIAPPRLFAVATPGASIVDLGCEYTLVVDERGAGSIAVQSGKVEVEGGGGQIVLLPASTRARLLPGRRAGLPLVSDAPAALIDAVHAYDNQERGAIARVLTTARPEDAFTVATLAQLAPRTERRAILTTLAALSPPPDGVTLEGAVTSDPQLAAWHLQIVVLLDVRAFLRFE